MIRCFYALFFAVWAVSANAQDQTQDAFYPEYESTTVNDFAGLLTPEQRDQLDKTLTDLRRDTGVEMTVVTLTRQATYNPEVEMEAFATGLFNHWGVGDATRNDGIMVLVLYQDRAMRVELGAGYGSEWDRAAKTVIDRSFLPKFRENYYATGIIEGVDDVIQTIAVPFREGAEPPKGSGTPWWIALIFLPIGLVVFAGKIGDFFARFRTCPQCGAKGTLRVSRTVLQHATTSSSGHGTKHTHCTACGYSDTRSYTIPRRSKSSSSSSFGGGRSSGGGASGRW